MLLLIIYNNKWLNYLKKIESLVSNKTKKLGFGLVNFWILNRLNCKLL